MKELSRRGSCVDKTLRCERKNADSRDCKQFSAIGVRVKPWRTAKDRDQIMAMVAEQF